MLCGRKCLVDAVKTAVLRDQLERGLFANTGNARDIVRAIPHQCLDVNKLRGLDTVFFKKAFLVHVHGIVVGGKQNVHMIADQL